MKLERFIGGQLAMPSYETFVLVWFIQCIITGYYIHKIQGRLSFLERRLRERTGFLDQLTHYPSTLTV